MQVKICGITNIDDARFCIESGAHALGFIFYPKSPRYIEPGKAAEIISRLPPFTATVGVVVDKTAEDIIKLSQISGISMVQYHGSEEPDLITKIHLPAIKALQIGPEFDFRILENFQNCRILLDTFHKEQYGGTGETFDWNLIPKNIRNRIVLAGGIDSSNLATVMNQIQPAAVDLSSSIEETPGVKDKEKVRRFFQTLHSLE